MVAAVQVRISATGIEASRLRRGRVEWRAACSIPDRAALEEALGALASAEGWKPVRRARVQLDGVELVQERHLRDLPPLPVSSISDIVALQQSRFFRRNGAPLVTAVRRLHLDDEGSVIHAVAADEEFLEAVHRGLRTTGIRQVTVVHEGSGLELQAPSFTAEQKKARHRHRRALLAAGVALWITAGAIHAGRLVAAERTLKQRMTEFEEAERAIAAARRRMAAAATMVAIVDSARVRAPGIALMTGRLVGALPDAAWIRSLMLREDKGELATKGASAGVLRARLAPVTGVTDLVVEGASAAEEAGAETATLRFHWVAP